MHFLHATFLLLEVGKAGIQQKQTKLCISCDTPVANDRSVRTKAIADGQDLVS